ncbi:MAG: calcium-binding protein [Nocardioides sp.]
MKLLPLVVIAAVASIALTPNPSAGTDPQQSRSVTAPKEQWPDKEADCTKAPYHPLTELVDGHLGKIEPMKDQGILRVNTCGINYASGQQNSNMTVKMSNGKLRLTDKGTKSWKRISDNCRRVAVDKGVSAVCTIPKRFKDSMFLTVWPRLGNDRIIATKVPSWIRVWVLTDAGHDVVKTGPGDDFINGAMGRDRLFGGPGQDWIRGGDDADLLNAGPGNDGGMCTNDEIQIVAGDGVDTIIGGPGSDCLYSGEGKDRIRAEDQNTDRIVCGRSKDQLKVDRADITLLCS